MSWRCRSTLKILPLGQSAFTLHPLGQCSPTASCGMETRSFLQNTQPSYATTCLLAWISWHCNIYQQAILKNYSYTAHASNPRINLLRRKIPPQKQLFRDFPRRKAATQAQTKNIDASKWINGLIIITRTVNSSLFSYQWHRLGSGYASWVSVRVRVGLVSSLNDLLETFRRRSNCLYALRGGIFRRRSTTLNPNR